MLTCQNEIYDHSEVTRDDPNDDQDFAETWTIIDRPCEEQAVGIVSFIGFDVPLYHETGEIKTVFDILPMCDSCITVAEQNEASEKAGEPMVPKPFGITEIIINRDNLPPQN